MCFRLIPEPDICRLLSEDILCTEDKGRLQQCTVHKLYGQQNTQGSNIGEE